MRKLVLFGVALAAGCASEAPAPPASVDGDPEAFHRLVPDGAAAETLADGFVWSEGPVWRPASRDLLFSDVPANTAYRWSDVDGLGVFLQPSSTEAGPGSNGLALDADGHLVLAEHGRRAVTRLDTTAGLEVLADRYDGRRLNSPNDLVVHSSGAIYFTDPPYGLDGHDESPDKEQPHNGVYRLGGDGEVTLLVDSLARPNGVILSPDERTLTVANSDSLNAIWVRYPVLDDGRLGEGRLLFDATAWVREGRLGLPDGMAVDAEGNLFATGPGGVLVFSASGDYLGTVETERATANVAFGDADGRSLFLTSHDRLLRVRTTTRGLGF